MTKVQKIILPLTRDIPFTKLVLSQSNVRKISTNLSIEDLAEDIARRGLLQSLNVRPILDVDGNETGMFEVPAGGRRYRALALLVQQKRLAKNAPIPCIVFGAVAGQSAIDDSLAENTHRSALHPLDQFRAFQNLRETGMTEEAIAAAYFVPVTVVRQRLRLASVAPSLLDAYIAEEMTLEMVMAFTVNEDHERQQQVWEAVKVSWDRNPHKIRRMLTETAVRASDKRAQFVGVEAYEAAGGVVLRDLFESDQGGWLQDIVLLDRLVEEKLKAVAESVAAEGWKWAQIMVDPPYGYDRGMREIDREQAILTEDENARYDVLIDEQERFENEYASADELPEEVAARLDAIEGELDGFRGRPLVYDPAEIARAGVFIGLDRDGALIIDRGYVRPEDENSAGVDETATEGTDAGETTTADDPEKFLKEHVTVIHIGNQKLESAEMVTEDEDEIDVVKPLSERLTIELTAYRTLALRDALARDPHVALTVLLHKLVKDTFNCYGIPSCLEASVRPVVFPVQPDDLNDSPPARAVTERHEDWKSAIPDDDEALWDYLDRLDNAGRMALLAHCVSFGVNALYQKPSPYGQVTQRTLDQRLRQADRLAQATNLDLIDTGWKPTVNNYLGRVSKPRILEAVREGAGERAAELIDHLKKSDMAQEAERLLADSGWLPEPLRNSFGCDAPADEADVAVENDATSDGDTLPAFLGEENSEEEEEEAAALANAA